MFYSIKNLIDPHARVVEKPWELVNDAPYGMKKAEFRKWSQQPDTDHHWINLCQGVSANVRINGEENPVYEAYGIIADYDAPMPPGLADHLKKTPVCEYLPAWLCATQSGNFRVIWFFEKPFRFASHDHYHEFMKHVLNVMKLDKWGAGLDGGRLVQPGTYYELGKDWTKLSDYVIPYSTLCAWDHVSFMKASQRMTLGLDGIDVKIPMDVIAAKVELKYPGRWQGEFKVGARGVRFWDSTADHPQGVTVCESGVRVWTPHDKPFMSWLDIFGRAFVEEFVGDRAKQVVDRAFYDGQTYWFEAKPGEWESEATDKFSQSLRVLGFDDKRSKGETCSEVDRLQVRVRREKKVDGASPVIYRPTGLLVHPDTKRRILNIESIMPIRPAAPNLAPNTPWGKAASGFPFIHRILSQMFVDQKEEHDLPEWLADYEPDIQLYTLLAWIKRTYEGGLSMCPTVGQVMIIVGPPNKGKTLVNRRIIGSLLGGSADGTRHMMEGEKFNAELVRSPVVTLDDPVGDQKKHQEFELRLKQVVANGMWRSELKFRQAVDAPWCGRFVISCNDDAISMRKLPGLSASNHDKVIMLKCGNQRVKFSGSFDENQQRIERELAYFGRWLVDWTPPHETQGDMRYGIKPFHHPELVNTISETGNVGTLLEIMDATFRDAPENQTNDGVWEGTAAKLYELLTLGPASSAMKSMNFHTMTQTLAIMKRNGCKIGGELGKNRRAVWKIPYDQSKLQAEEGKQ